MPHFKKHIPSIVLGLVGGAFLCAAGVAIASRNAAGTYSLATGPYVTGTTISATAVNSEFSDIATELTSSLDRSGRGGMLSNLRGIDGTAAAPALSFTSETGTGLYRVGTGDLGLSVSGAKLMDYQGTGETVSLAGSGGGAPGQFFQGSLANATAIQLRVGKSAAANAAGLWTFTPQAVAANATACLDVYGQVNTLCVDGNAKTTVAGTGGMQIGSTGTAITQINTGVGTFNGAATATFTATVASGAKCVATRDAVGGAAGVSAAVSGTTLTVTSTVSLDTHTATWICF